MVPEDGEPVAPAAPTQGDRPGPVATTEDAFAATIAPASVTPPMQAPDASSAAGSVSRPRPPSAFESDETVTAPVEGVLAPLPIVPTEHYKPDKEIARGGMGRIVAAADVRLGRPVALKELIEPVPEQLGRF